MSAGEDLSGGKRADGRPAEDEPVAGIPLFRIAGIRIVIDPSWFLIFFLVTWSLAAGFLPERYPGASRIVYWLAGLAASVAFFASILFHELAHSLVALRSGIRIPSITLFLFGGVSRLAEEAPDPRTELRIAIVGPLSSFLLAGVFWLVARRIEPVAPALLTGVVDYLAFINLALGVFNLMPGFPLDGGRVLRAIWWWKTGSVAAATKLASDMGKGLALGLMLLGGLSIFGGALLGGLWLIFIGMFLRGTAEQGYQELVLRQSLSGVAVGEVMVREPVAVPEELPLDRFVRDYVLRYGYRGYPVVGESGVVGVVSVEDLRRIDEAQWTSLRVRDAMRPLGPERTIGPDAPLLEALEKMTRGGEGRLVVLDGGRMVGLVTKTGLLRLLELRRILGASGEARAAQ